MAEMTSCFSRMDRPATTSLPSLPRSFDKRLLFGNRLPGSATAILANDFVKINNFPGFDQEGGRVSSRQAAARGEDDGKNSRKPSACRTPSTLMLFAFGLTAKSGSIYNRGSSRRGRWTERRVIELIRSAIRTVKTRWKRGCFHAERFQRLSGKGSDPLGTARKVVRFGESVSDRVRGLTLFRTGPHGGWRWRRVNFRS